MHTCLLHTTLESHVDEYILFRQKSNIISLTLRCNMIYDLLRCIQLKWTRMACNQRHTVSKPDIENTFHRHGATKNILFSD